VVVILVFAAIVAMLLLTEWSFRRFVSPKIRDIFENVPPFNVIPEPRNPDAQRIEFRTSDGILLRGSLLNSDVDNPPALVLFLPELHGSHWTARRYCDALLKQRYMVLSFDFRNQGESESMDGYLPIHWMTEYEMTDVATALEFVESNQKLDSLPLVVFGVSRGGVAALLTGCRYPRIQAVIADSAFGTMAMIRFFVDRFVQHVIPEWLFALLPNWHIRITLKQAVQLSESGRKCRYAHLEDEVKGLESANVLLISGARDSYVTPVIAGKLHEVVGKQAELWLAPGAKHNMSRAVQTEEYDRRIVAHFERCLNQPVTKSAPADSRVADHHQISAAVVSEAT
jgi:pimeloyl-ACP methyl ester carboxylesterase